MSDTEEVANGVNAFNFDEWANGLSLRQSTTQALRNEELTTQETLKMLEAKDLKELGLPMGSVKLILKAVNQWNCAPGPTEPTPIEDKEDMDNVAILEGAGMTFYVHSRTRQPLSPKKLRQFLAKWTLVPFLPLSHRPTRPSTSPNFLWKKANAAVRAGGRNLF